MFDRQRLLRLVLLAAAISLSAALAAGKVPTILEFLGLNAINNVVTQPFFTTVAWTNDGLLTGWFTSTNWTPNMSAGQWQTTDIAQFNDAGFASTAGINMATSQLSIGAIEITSVRTRALTIGNSSTTARTLTLNGATLNSQPNVILRNASSSLMSLQNNETGSGKTMNIALANPTDNLILIDGGGGITISSVIGGMGKNLTVAGSGDGVLRLFGANTYSGSTTIKNNGTIDLGDTGSLANTPVIEIQGGGAFDVQSLLTPFVLGPTQTLKASGSGTTALIATSLNRGFTTSSGGSLIFSAFNGGATAPLTISGTGGMALQPANQVTISVSQGGTPLGIGNYKLIAKTNNGFVTGTPTSLTVNGDSVCSGCSYSLVLIAGELYLNVTANGSPTLTPTATPSNTATSTSTSTATATQTPTSTSTSTPTATQTPTSTSTATATATFTPTATATASASATFTTTPTEIATSTSTPTPVNRPSVITDPATNVTSTSVQLNGSADPNGEATFGHFRYSLNHPGTCDDGFGTRLPASSASDVALGAGGGAIPFALNATGLSPGATYYFCAIASNGYTDGYGSVLSVTATPTEPAVTTNEASLVTGTEAQLNGAANPNGGGAIGWFRYSATDPGSCSDSFGTRAPSSGAVFLGSGISPVGYSQGVIGLTPGTTYYYCAIALNNIGFAFGPLVAFTTPLPPTTTTVAATNITGATALLNGSADPNAALTAGWFRYSTTDPVTCDDAFGTRAPLSGGVSLGFGTAAQAYSQPINGLSAGTTFYFCAIATNLEGTTFGAVLSFTTTNATPSPTHTPTATPTAIFTPTASDTPTNTATNTPTAAPSQSPTFTPTETATLTPANTPTATATSSPTLTSTDTPTPAPTAGISGMVTYGNAMSGPPRFVSNVTISAAGSPNLTTTTGPPGATAGQYSLTGFGAGAYTVTPTKTGGVNGITSFDAALIARHVTGALLLSGGQLIAADVSNNGGVSSFDAAQIARYAASAPPFGITGTWRFVPANRFYSSVTGDIVSQDFTALLMGDVSGNWTNTAARPANDFDPSALSWLLGDLRYK